MGQNVKYVHEGKKYSWVILITIEHFAETRKGKYISFQSTMKLDLLYRIKFTTVHMYVYKSMIPFSWYHHGDKRHGPFKLLYGTVQLT